MTEYTRDEIEQAKASPSFEREYNLKYLGRVGNVFHILDIEAAICTQKEGQEMTDWSTSEMIGRSMGIDVAWGNTSKFAIVITQYRNNKVEVFSAESFEQPQMNEIIDDIMQLKQRHHCTRVYIDGANPEVIRELKRRIGEYQEYHDFTEEEIWAFRNSSWQIIPVNFQKRRAFASMIILLSAVNEGIGASFVGAFEDDKVTKILGYQYMLNQ